MRIVSLASGSKGNAYCLEAGGCGLMIDCGLSCKELAARAQAANVDLSKIAAVVFTHSHDDHVKGVGTFHKRYPSAELFANAMTAETIVELQKLDGSAFICFENGQSFGVGPFTVRAFSIPHDTSDPVGYLVTAEGETYFHGTDIGTPLDSIGVRLAEADVATLESNHDLMLLKSSGRPPCLIQRIYGPRGHLSNDQACELVRRFAGPRLKRLALAHLSQDCNEPHLARNAMTETLAAMKRTDVRLTILAQDSTCEI